MAEAWIIWSGDMPIGVRPSRDEAEYSARLDTASGRKLVMLSGPHKQFDGEAGAYKFPIWSGSPAPPTKELVDLFREFAGEPTPPEREG